VKFFNFSRFVPPIISLASVSEFKVKFLNPESYFGLAFPDLISSCSDGRLVSDDSSEFGLLFLKYGERNSSRISEFSS